METQNTNNSPTSSPQNWLGSLKSRYYSGSRKHKVNAISIMLGAITFCVWTAYTACLPAIIFSTTQNPVDVSVEQIENGEMPYQFNWNLSGFHPAIEACIPMSFDEDEVNQNPELQGFYLPLVSDRQKLGDEAKKPVVILEANLDFIQQRNFPDENASLKIIELAFAGQIAGHRSISSTPISSLDLEKLQEFYPGHSAHDFVVFTANDSTDKTLFADVVLWISILGLFFAVFGLSAMDCWKKHVAEKKLETKIENGDFCLHNNCNLALQFINQRTAEPSPKLLEPFNPPPLHEEKKLHPVTCLLAVTILPFSFLGITIGGFLLANNIWQQLPAMLVAFLAYRFIMRRLWAYLSRREPAILQAWFPQSKLQVGESTFYHYHRRVLDGLGFTMIGESGTRHFFACPNQRLLAVLGEERRSKKQYFSLVSVLQGGEIVQTTSLPKRIRTRSLHESCWFINPVDDSSICRAIEKHCQVIGEMHLENPSDQFAITESNYLKVVQHVDRVYETAWASMLENTWFAI